MINPNTPQIALINWILPRGIPQVASAASASMAANSAGDLFAYSFSRKMSTDFLLGKQEKWQESFSANFWLEQPLDF